MPAAIRTSTPVVALEKRRRVVDELLQDATGDAAVQVRRRRLLHRGNGDAFVARGHLPGDLGDVHPFGQPRVDREFEPFDELGEVASPGDEPGEELLLLLGRGHEVRERLGDPEDHGHRGPELVREPGDELLPSGRALHECGLRGFELPDPSPLALERLGELLDHARGYLGGQERPSLGGAAYGGQDLVAVGILQDVAGGPATSMPRTISWSSWPESATPRGREVRLEQARGLDAVHRGHPDVHQYHVGLERTHELEASAPEPASPTT